MNWFANLRGQVRETMTSQEKRRARQRLLIERLESRELLAATVFVDDNFTGATPGFGVDHFATIQEGVDAVDAGGIVSVAAGTYKENVTIGKAVTLLGANATVTGAGTRGAESLVITNGASAGGVFNVSSNNVVIKGFDIDGDDPLVVGAALKSGDDADALYGVRVTGAFTNVTVENNIIEHVFIGFRGDGASAGNLITGNWFDSIGNFDFGYGVSLRTNFYADVTNNLMTRVWTGIHTNNFNGTGGPATWIVSGNDIHSYAGGLLYWLQYNGATGMTIDNNDFSAETGAVANNFGVLMVSIQDAVSPTFTNNTITGTDYGVGLTNVSTSNTITLGATNSIGATKIAGVYLTDNLTFNPVGLTDLTSDIYTDPIGVVVDGLTLLPSTGAGILVEASRDPAADVATTLTLLNGPTITGGTNGVVFSGAETALTGNSFDALALSGQTGQYILLTNGAFDNQTLDATGVSFGGVTGASATLAQNLAIEDKITHAVDDASLGFVRVKANNVFVTTNSFAGANTTGSIQRAVDLAASGDTVNVGAGTYNEDVAIATAGIHLIGADHDTTIIRGIPGGDTSTIHVLASNVEIAGFTISRLGNTVADWNDPTLNTAGIAIQGQTITGTVIHDNILTGNRTAIDINNSNGNTIRNNVISSNRTGLVFRNQTDNTVVTENVITGNFTVGILFLDASGGTNIPVQSAVGSTFFNNNISGNWYGQVVDRQANGLLPTPGTTNKKDFSGNWFGTTNPVITSNDSAEPAYADLIPTEFGGTATAPGGQPDFAGIGVFNLDITPMLSSSIDTNVETVSGRGTFGFQGNFAALTVTSELAQTGTANRLDEAVDLVTAAGTVNVLAGEYDISSGVTIDKQLTLTGAKAGIAGTNVARGTNETILYGPINQSLGAFTISTTSPVTLNGFTFEGAKIVAGNPSGTDLRFLNNIFNLAAMTAPGGTNMIINDPVALTLTNNLFTTTGSNPTNSAVIQVVGDYTGTGDTTNVMNITGNTFRGVADVNGQSTLQLNLSSVQGTVQGNTFDDVDIGVIVANNSGNLSLSSNLFQDITRGSTEIAAGSLGAGILIFTPSFNGPVTIANNQFLNSDTGIRTSNAGGTLTGATLIVSGNTFTGNLFHVVHRLTGTIVLDDNNVFDGITLGSATDAQLFAIEDKIVDGIDVSGYGLVRLKANNVYVTPNSFYVPDGTTSASIQRAVNIASSGEIVNIAAGTYSGHVLTAGKGVTLSPGGNAAAKVTINGNLTLDSDDTLAVNLNGTTAGTQYDQLAVSGTVTLGNAALAVTRSFFPAQGTAFTIIDGSSPIVGTFSNGSSVSASGVNLGISYANNDVTLTATALGDDFNRADSTNLGANWTEILGDFFIQGTQLRTQFQTNSLAVFNPVVAADVTVQADINTVNSIQAGLVARFNTSSSGNSYYLGRIVNSNGTFTAQILKVVNGRVTVLASQNVTSGSGTLKFVLQGFNLALFLDGVSVAVATDTTLRGAGLTGVFGAAGSAFDNFTAGQSATGLPFTDNFDRGTQPNLGSDWTTTLGTVGVQSNKAVGTSAGFSLAVYNGAAAADVSVQAVITIPGAEGQGALVARYVNNSNFYFARLLKLNSGTSIQIVRVFNGQLTVLGSQAVNASSGTLLFEVHGTTLSVSLNGGTALTVNDSSLLGAGEVGIRGGQGVTFDNFTATKYVSAPFTDNFNRTAGTNLGANYTEVLGNLVIKAATPDNVLAGTTSTPSQAVYTGLSAVDVDLQATVNLTSAGAVGLIARYTDNKNFVMGAIVRDAGGASSAVIYRVENGVVTVLSSQTLASSSGALRFVVQGTSLTLSLNGTTAATATDTAIVNAGLVGIRSVNQAEVDDFSVTDISV